jgi:hypothetical protein
MRRRGIKSSNIAFSMTGFSGMSFDWQKTVRQSSSRIAPIVVHELRAAAPVSQKPDAGRFRDSIGFQSQSGYGAGAGSSYLLFVSTSPYAKYILEGTQAGALIEPRKTKALRFTDEFSGYVFARSVIRGATRPNNFNEKVATRIEPMVSAIFKDSLSFVFTK